MEKGVIYARYSSHNQREQSIEDQIKACKEYAEANNITIVGVYADYAKTGRNDKRAEFQRMLHDSDKKDFQIVLIWKIDRFGRDRQEMALNKYRLKKNNVRVVSIMENIPESPEGVLVESLMEGMAEYYSRNLSENVKRGHHSNAEKAIYNGGMVPEGLKVENQKYVIDENRSPIVQKIYKLCVQGYTYTEISEYLKEKGIKSRRGNDYDPQVIKGILNNRKYIGEYIYDDVVVPDAIPPIINEELFNRAQVMQSVNKHSKRTIDKNDYVLSGKLICGNCGCPYIAESGTGCNGVLYKYYKCSTNKLRGAGSCDSVTFRKEKVESFIIDKTLDVVLTEKRIKEISEAISKNMKEDNTELVCLETEYDNNKKKMQNLLSSIEKGINDQIIFDRINELGIINSELEEKIEVEKLRNRTIDQEAIEWFLKSMKKGLITGSEKLRVILDQLIKEVLIVDEGFLITYYPDQLSSFAFISNKKRMVDLNQTNLKYTKKINGLPLKPFVPIIMDNLFCVNMPAEFLFKNPLRA